VIIIIIIFIEGCQNAAQVHTLKERISYSVTVTVAVFNYVII